MVRKQQQNLRDANSSKSLATAGSTAVTKITQMQQQGTHYIRHILVLKGSQSTQWRQQHQWIQKQQWRAPTTVTPTIQLMPATAVTPEEAGTPAAANEFCGDSQKIFKMAKTYSAYTKYKPKLIPLLLSISGMVNWSYLS
jgi:hypothetical protein